jgi:Protein of unknown function (DUF2380)
VLSVCRKNIGLARVTLLARAAQAPLTSADMTEEQWLNGMQPISPRSLLTGGAAPDAGGNPRVAFFGVELINTSLQPTQPAEEKRLEMLGIILRDQLAGAGRFSFVAIPPEVQNHAARRFWNSELQRM